MLEQGGEVLRFIGDASLAVFPVSRDAPPRESCLRAIAAARLARQRVREANARRTTAGLPGFACGVGLHVGRVLYGNIGTVQRLEFSVIGAAANETARIEGLCKTTGEDVVLSRSVADAIGNPWPALGTFELRGVGHGIEVCALPQAA